MRSASRVGFLVGVLLCGLPPRPASAQTTPPEPQVTAPQTALAVLPPATMLEGFRQPIGSTLTLAYDELGEVDGVFVDVREVRDTLGGRARGLVVEIAGPQALREQSFIDADEIPGMMEALDKLVAITANPTQFRSFEVRYMTRGEMGLTASSSRNRGVVYGVEVGRLVKARRALSAGQMHQLRTLFEVGSQKLATLVPEK